LSGREHVLAFKRLRIAAACTGVIVEKRADESRSFVYCEIGSSEKLCINLTFSLAKVARVEVRPGSMTLLTSLV